MRRQLMSGGSSSGRWLAFLAVCAILLGAASETQARISIVSGTLFLQEGDPNDDPVEEIFGFGFALADDELDNGDRFIDTDLGIGLADYVDVGAPVTVGSLFLDLDDPNDPNGVLSAEFLFGPGTLETLPSPPGVIGSGSITADIIGIGPNNDTGVNLDHFVGGSFQLTYNGMRITPGAGGGSAEIDFPSTASYSLAVVPEPASLLLAVFGAVGLLFMGRISRRRRRQPST
ncbi:MAG: PEP-CTERM sorting domain-containing protein [Planctomycetes bacterium]|nr:PEP-CTERM sorting domain-containing protein [Planctomycetota bacterium]